MLVEIIGGLALAVTVGAILWVALAVCQAAKHHDQASADTWRSHTDARPAARPAEHALADYPDGRIIGGSTTEGD